MIRIGRTHLAATTAMAVCALGAGMTGCPPAAAAPLGPDKITYQAFTEADEGAATCDVTGMKVNQTCWLHVHVPVKSDTTDSNRKVFMEMYFPEIHKWEADGTSATVDKDGYAWLPLAFGRAGDFETQVAYRAGNNDVSYTSDPLFTLVTD
ncbi:hypothetical protein K4749_12465 [Streptomyces sp. TRM72054]|uniref:hypothetical protein n=1 Tax=Streptomyces sp. TRM72054 TaxID=2870562 RepID=UPI001C8CE127|nr:hypothetical protein [Streptomyces sp. TRM72054]MBX9394393.1 hypothetical protein [Streptomyces sp. TRM72054]